MLPYIKADTYRLIKHKSNRWFFFILILIYITLMVGLAFIHDQFFEVLSSTYIDLGYAALGTGALLPILGIHSYKAVFSTDLTSSILPSIFTTGLSKIEFLLGKVVTFTLYYLFSLTILTVTYFIGWAVIASQTPMQSGINEIQQLLMMAFVLYIALIGYALLANTIGYFTQKNSLALTSYILLNFGFVHSIIFILQMMSERFENIYPYLFTSQFTVAQELIRTGEELFPHKEIGIMLIYCLGAFLLNWIILKKVEIKESV